MIENNISKENIINSIFTQSNTTPSDEKIRKLQIYCNELIQVNKSFNLTAITEENEIYLLHFLDCAIGAQYIPQNASVCDIGSGAGFPGLILALLRPDLKVTLIDSLRKRIDFLHSMAAKLSVPCECIHARAEDISGLQRESFDVATSRAVAPLNVLAEYMLPYVKIGGFMMAYKGPAVNDELSSSDNAFALLGGAKPVIKQYNLDKYLRCLVFSEKNSATPQKYPRKGNKPRLAPL